MRGCGKYHSPFDFPATFGARISLYHPVPGEAARFQTKNSPKGMHSTAQLPIFTFLLYGGGILWYTYGVLLYWQLPLPSY